MGRRELSSRLPVMLWILAGSCSCALVSGFEPNLLEEGIGLHVAQRLAQGERLYRDVLVFTGPLPFELLAVLFRVFGEEVRVARAVVIVLHALATGAAFALARAARPGPAAHAAAAATASAPLLLFPLFGIYFYTTMAFQLSVMAAWAAWRGAESARWAGLAGVLVAAVALCKQPIGLALALTLGLALLAAGRVRAKPLFAFAAGGGGVALVTIALWAAGGVLEEALYAMVSLPASFDATFEMPFPSLWPLGVLTGRAAETPAFYLPYFYSLTQGILATPSGWVIFATQLLFALPLLAAAATAVRLAWRRGAPPAFLFHAALSLTWLTNLFPRTDWGHLVYVLPLAFAQLCITLPGAPSRSPSRWRPAAARLLAGAVLAGFAAASGLAGWTVHRVADPEPLAARVPLRPVSPGLRGAQLRGVIDFLEHTTRRGEFIFVARAEPLVYFATDTRNPTPYPGIFPAIRDEQQRTILAALQRVRFVVMSDVDQPAMTYYRDELPAVQAHLERFFHPAERLQDSNLQWLSVLERGRDRGATAVDLIALAPTGRPFTRSRDGTMEPAPRFPDRLPTRRNRRLLAFSLGPGGGGIDFEVDVPERAVFQADASLDRVFGTDEIFGIPWRSRVVVSIGRPGEMVPLAEVTLENPFSGKWLPLEADLARWAGQRVTLRMEVIPPARRPVGRVAEIGYLGSPRIAYRADPAGPRAGR